MSVSLGLTKPPASRVRGARFNKFDWSDADGFGSDRERQLAQGWYQRWERALTWWSMIAMCLGFWLALMHLAGVV